MIHTATIDTTINGCDLTLVHSFTPEGMHYLLQQFEKGEMDVEQYIRDRGDLMKEVLEKHLREVFYV